MALFGSARDASLFRHLNKELINDIVSVDVVYFKLSLNDTEENVYGESSQKVYYNPVKIKSLVGREGQVYTGDEFGMDYNQEITFGFLRDTMNDHDIFPEVGDIVEWDLDYFEIDGIVENNYVAGKNPDTDFNDGTHGYNVSFVCTGHLSRKSRINILDVRSGITKTIEIAGNK